MSFKRAKKSEKREQFINNIIKEVISHERFEPNVKRKSNETDTQLALFQRLEKKTLTPIIQDFLDCSQAHAEKIVLDNFKWEGDKNTTVNHFTRFGTQHRPDATLEINNLSIAIEIKQGQKGSAIRSGLGQCVLYSSIYDFIIYVFVDQTVGSDITNTVQGDAEKKIIEQLWNDFNTKFIVV